MTICSKVEATKIKEGQVNPIVLSSPQTPPSPPRVRHISSGRVQLLWCDIRKVAFILWVYISSSLKEASTR